MKITNKRTGEFLFCYDSTRSGILDVVRRLKAEEPVDFNNIELCDIPKQPRPEPMTYVEVFAVDAPTPVCIIEPEETLYLISDLQVEEFSDIVRDYYPYIKDEIKKLKAKRFVGGLITIRLDKADLEVPFSEIIKFIQNYELNLSYILRTYKTGELELEIYNTYRGGKEFEEYTLETGSYHTPIQSTEERCKRLNLELKMYCEEERVKKPPVYRIEEDEI